MSEMEIHTSETIETLEKKKKDRRELYAKLEEYKAIARERDEWKKKYDKTRKTLKEEEIKTPERVIFGEGEPSITGGSGKDELLGWIQ